MPLIDLTLAPETDPLNLYRFRDSLYSTDLLAAALVWLDLFTWLESHPSDLAAICEKFQLYRRPADVMMTLFKSMGLVTENQGVFQVTPVAREHLVSTSPWFIGPYYAAMKDRPVTKDYLTVLRTGKPANWASLQDQKAWAQAMEGEAFARQFTAAMDCRGRYLGQALARKVDLRGVRCLLDVAGGSGIYACSLVAANPALRATVLEKVPVDAIARRCIEERGFSDRISVSAGDMFRDAWPSEPDAHLISNVLHDWDEPQVMQLLHRSFEALPSDGKLLIHDVHIDADKSGPLPNAQYSALLMNITEGKCYSVGEMEGYLAAVGFERPAFHPTAVDRSVLIAHKP